MSGLEQFPVTLRGIPLRAIGADQLAVVHPDGSRTPVLGFIVRQGQTLAEAIASCHPGCQVVYDTRIWLVFASSERQAYCWAQRHELPRGRWRFVMSEESVMGLEARRYQAIYLPGWEQRPGNLHARERWRCRPGAQ